MMKKGNKHQSLLSAFRYGRDENNMAEFPLTLLSDSAPSEQKMIEFEDTMEDWQTGLLMTRRVCITGSEKFGLPTAKDEEVLLALLQLTHLSNQFNNPEVHFTKHQVIQVLGWQNRGWAYDRVEESLHRWKDVSIHYWNAWRDNARGKWRDSAAIGVIDYFMLFDGRQKRWSNSCPQGMSKFVWHKVFFESFKSGYLKKLDFATYRALRRPAAKRAYRFLDKRFYHKPCWEFELRQFACEKLGFSRSYTTGQLKERLNPALSELEQIGFIEQVRYEKKKPKVWNVCIVQKNAEVSKDNGKGPGSDEIIAELTCRGIAVKAAAELVFKFSHERVTEKIELHDWLLERKDKRIDGNPAGFLVAAIRSDYVMPKGFKSKAQRERELKENDERRSKAEEVKRRAQAKQDRQLEIRLWRVRQYLATLDECKRRRFIEKAIAADNGMLRAQYFNNEQHAKVQEPYLELMLRNHFEKLVGELHGPGSR